jgi:hypothetical protein
MKTRILLSIAFLIGIAGIGLFLNGNANSQKPEATTGHKKPEQFIVLLDLSDRIVQPGQIEADKQLIEKTFEEFEKNIHAQLVINSNDRFQVCIAPQKNLPFDKDSESENFTLDLSSIKIAERVPQIRKFKQTLRAKLDELYTKAYVGNDTRKYEGSNIWQFFNETLPALVGDKITTKLVVVTDGYFDFEQDNAKSNDGNLSTTTDFCSRVREKHNWKSAIESNGYGILPIKKPIKNISVCISELRSKHENNLNETDMLQYIWRTWLIRNGIPDTSCQTILHGNISNTGQQLSVFLNRII